MIYDYNKEHLNKDLVIYIEENIFPEYNKNEKAHDINHIISVINHAFNISKNYDVDLNLIYTAVAFHDIGHHIDKDNHEIISADIMSKDTNLNTFFNSEELNTIKLAIEDHRASSNHEPRNIYGKIISAADKNLTVNIAITRTYLYSKKYYPNFTHEELFEEIYKHLNEKFGKNGYAKIYIIDEDFNSFKKDLIALLENKENFFKKVSEIEKQLQN